MRPRALPAHVGLALGPGTAAAARRARGGVTRRWARALDADAWRDAESLGAVVREACEALGAPGARLSVALLPPLVRCRLADLPGLRGDELARVLARDVESWFPARGEPQAVGAARLHRRAPRAARPVALAAADERLADAVFEAAGRAGCQVAALVPAYAAWAAAAPALGDGGPLAMVVVGAARVEVLRIEGGEVIGLRRFPAALPDERGTIDHVLAALGGGGGEASAAPAAPVVLVGDAPLAAPLAAALTERGTPLADVGEPAPSAEALAAEFAPAAAGPLLLPERERAEYARRDRRRTVATLALAAGLLLAAGALELWGTRRELHAVAERRAALRESLGGVLATRDSVAAIAARLATLRAAEAGAPRWSATVAAVAAHLPRDAYLLSLRAEGDSVVLDGVAERAAPVFDALGRAPGVLAVRAQGSIRQELRDGGALEHFTLVARLAGPAAAGGRP